VRRSPAARDEPDPARIEDLFARALELSPDRRAVLLAEQCGASPELRRAVESLLDAHAATGGPFERLDAGRAADLLAAVHLAGPEDRRIGPYRLVREIGRGGMGTVYLAERVEGGFEQRVALKLVHASLGSEEMLERFRRERQILARLEHPGIARLLDGGVTADGQPWFAMELVEGEPITRWAARRELPVSARLELFVQVCEAVQWAHGGLVVHRDLKPSNVLVTGEGRVKLVDFGIAKVLEPAARAAGSADGGAPPTRDVLRSLTPEYASPEQVLGEPVTTASDVYALGVVLYELLTGRLPYDGPLTTPAQVVRAVCDTVPPPPSKALSAGAAEGSRRYLDRDLDAVCLKALAKDRDRRYGSVEAFAEDVRRHLDGLPVSARRPSAAYRAGKFVRRHRWGVAAAAAAVLALVLGLAGIAWQARVAADERDQTAAEASKALEIQEFLTSLLQSVDPGQTGGAPWTADELLGRGVERIDALLPEQPEVAADLLGVMGGVSGSLGEYERAEALWRRSLELRRRDPGPQGLELSEGLRGLASVLYPLSRFEETDALLAEALALGRRAAQEDPETGEPELAKTLEQIGVLYHDTSRLDEADAHYREVLSLRRRRFGAEHVDTAAALVNLGGLVRERGDLDESAGLLREGLEIERRLLGERHPSVGMTLTSLATTLARKGDYRQAEPLHREALAIAREAWGDEHPQITTKASNLALLLYARGEYRESAELFEEVLALDRRQLGPRHRYVAFSLDNMGRSLTELGRLDEALERFEEGYGILVEARGPDDPDAAASLVARSAALRLRGEPERAVPLLEQARTIFLESFGPRHWRQVDLLCELGAVHAALGRTAEAEESYRAALAIQHESRRDLSRVRIGAGLGRLLSESERPAEARSVLEEAVGTAREILPEDHPYRHDAELALAAALAAGGDAAGARTLATAVLERLAGRSDLHTERLRLEAAELVER
jgi:serine/threonine-protein kinase